MDIIRAIEQQQIKQDIPDFKVGDNEGPLPHRRRQPRAYPVFPGRRHSAVMVLPAARPSPFTKIGFSVGVERTFPVHSPKIDKVGITPPRRRASRQANTTSARRLARLRKSRRSRSLSPNTSFASLKRPLGAFSCIVAMARVYEARSSKETLMGVTVAEIKKRLSEADAEELAVLERALVADERKGVRNALAVAKRRLQAGSRRGSALGLDVFSFERSVREAETSCCRGRARRGGSRPACGALGGRRRRLACGAKRCGLNDSKQVGPPPSRAHRDGGEAGRARLGRALHRAILHR